MVVRFRLAKWLTYPLAGYPHLLFSLWMSLLALTAGFGVVNQSWMRLTLIFGLVLGFGLLLGLARRLPRWSASWIGYGLLFGLELYLGWFPAGVVTWAAGLIWLAAVLFILSLLARRDWQAGVLAALPIAPMFFWSLALDHIPDIPLRVLLWVVAGLALGGLSIALARLERHWLAVLLLALTVGSASLLISFAVSYRLILPLQPASLPGILVWTGNELGFLGSVVLFTAPAWLGWVLSRMRLLTSSPQKSRTPSI